MSCRVCDCGRFESFAQKEEWHFSRCAKCDFAFLDPMPDQSTLNRLYDDDRGITTNYYPKSASRHSRALRRALRLLPWTWRKSVLDIGCGGGFMVNAFRLLGAKAHGLDVNEQAISYAETRFPSCHFYSGSFQFFDANRTFDFIYSSELIEHISELAEYMQLIVRLTHLNSYVYITTPDLGSPNVPRPVTSWDVFAPPHHVQFFNERNLAFLFNRYGFEQIRKFPDKKAGLKILFKRIA